MKEIINPLLYWYQKNKRELPWRRDKDPYHVWISEIMLQQTRIEAVISYYQRFMKEIPTISDLASIHEDRLLKLWEGLGYYTRAKNLKKTAMIIQEQYQGEFPNTFKEILSLPGIGEYTASAIGSISFSLKEATVDGNVLRVYMRIHNSYENVDDVKVRKRVRENLQTILPHNSGDFNQAMMELGEVICLPNGMPKCEMCPLSKYCKSYHEKTYMKIPVKNKKKKKKLEHYTILLLTYQNQIAIEKRKNKSLLSGLYQFPNIEGHYNISHIKQYLEEHKIKYKNVQKKVKYTHIFTHKKWDMNSYQIEVISKYNLNHYKWVTLEELDRFYSLPTAFQPFRKVLGKKEKS